MIKKIATYLVLGIFVIAALVFVYLFITKGYSGKGTTTLPTQTPIATVVPNEKIGNVTSAKISLVVTSPINGATLNSTNAIIKGKTSSNADVFVNDISGKADASGNFSISIGLDEGINLIVVSANDADGNATQQELNVTVTSFE